MINVQISSTIGPWECEYVNGSYKLWQKDEHGNIVSGLVGIREENIWQLREVLKEVASTPKILTTN